MKKLLLLFAVTALFFAACKSDGGDGVGPDKTMVTIRLTDGPGRYDAVMLHVKSVVVITDKGQHTFDADGVPFNILRYRNGRDTVIAAEEIPAGRIEQVRLVLYEDGNRVIINGVSHNLTTPSGQTSGVKLNVHDDLTPGVAYTLKLDFDVAKSIVETGNGKFILKPVIRAIPVAVSGVLRGTVAPVTAYPAVYAINGTDTVGTVTDANGQFYIPGLAAGTYKVEFVPVSPFNITVVNSVNVTNGAVTDMGSVSIN